MAGAAICIAQEQLLFRGDRNSIAIEAPANPAPQLTSDIVLPQRRGSNLNEQRSSRRAECIDAEHSRTIDERGSPHFIRAKFRSDLIEQ